MNIKHLKFQLITVALMVLISTIVNGEQKIYAPGKVVYDLAVTNANELSHMLDRASLLQRLYQNDSFNASIVFVVHEGSIPFFVKTRTEFRELMQRARSLSLGEIIQFKICLASAKMQGFTAADFHEFVEIVPMADAELIELHNKGYTYLK